MQGSGVNKTLESGQFEMKCSSELIVSVFLLKNRSTTIDVSIYYFHVPFWASAGSFCHKFVVSMSTPIIGYWDVFRACVDDLSVLPNNSRFVGNFPKYSTGGSKDTYVRFCFR